MLDPVPLFSTSLYDSFVFSISLGCTLNNFLESNNLIQLSQVLAGVFLLVFIHIILFLYGFVVFNCELLVFLWHFVGIIWDPDWSWVPPESVYFCWSPSTQGHFQWNCPLKVYLDYACSINLDHEPREGGLWLTFLYSFTEGTVFYFPSFTQKALVRFSNSQAFNHVPYSIQLSGRSSRSPNSAKVSIAKVGFGSHSPPRILSFTLFRESANIILSCQLSNRLKLL